MNFDELSKDYMEKYKKLTIEKKELAIANTIDNINLAIEEEDIDRINKNYSKILEWNSYVSNLEGAREAINAQYKFLHLPSVMMFSIAFDEEEKKWKFNGEIN